MNDVIDEYKDAETQRRRDTKTQTHGDTETQIERTREREHERERKKTREADMDKEIDRGEKRQREKVKRERETRTCTRTRTRIYTNMHTSKRAHDRTYTSISRCPLELGTVQEHAFIIIANFADCGRACPHYLHQRQQHRRQQESVVCLLRQP